MIPRQVAAVAGALLLATAAPRLLPAQKVAAIEVAPRQQLSFGSVMPGVQTTRQPTMSGGAVWKVEVQNVRSTTWSFVLPSTLTRTGGGSLPVSFAGAFAQIVRVDDLAVLATFDPTVGLANWPTSDGEFYLVLGGVAAPAGAQRAGDYTGSITLTVSK